MKYLFTIWQPDGPPPPNIGEIMKEVQKFDAEMEKAGILVFNGGLSPASAATVVRNKANESLVTDGPYVEAKEHVGGIVVIDVRDLDEALKWAKKAAKAIPLPIEVRAFAQKP